MEIDASKLNSLQNNLRSSQMTTLNWPFTKILLMLDQ